MLTGAVGRRVVDHQHVAGNGQGRHRSPRSAPPRAAGSRVPRTSGARSESVPRPRVPEPIIAPVQATTPNNAEIAGRFELLADLLELDGAVAYRYLAYRKAAKTLRETPESVARLSEQGRLRELPGVGAAIADKVAELLETGNISALEQARGGDAARRRAGDAHPRHRPEDGPADLRRPRPGDARGRACRPRGTVAFATCPGLGEKTEQAILAGRRVGASAVALRVSVARLRPLAERVRDALLERAGRRAVRDRRAASGGTPRRPRTSTWSRRTTAPAEVADAFAAYDWVAAVEQRGETKVTCIAHDGTRVELRMVAAGHVRQPAAAPDRVEGAQRRPARGRGPPWAEGQRVRGRGGRDRRAAADRRRARGLRAAGHGVDPAGAARAPWRAGGGARRARCPSWSRSRTSAATCTAHTDWSDGKATLEQMVAAAIELGYGYLNITDHSPAVGFGMGLDAGRLRAQIERVRALAARARAGLHPARRLRGRHPPRRLAGLLGRAARAARRGGRQRPRVAPAVCRRPDEADLRGDGEPARRRARPPHRPADRRAASRTPSTSRR